MAVLEEKITMLDKKIMALDKKIDHLQKSIEGLKCFKARKKKEPSAYAKYIQKFFNHPEVLKLDGKERMKYLAANMAIKKQTIIKFSSETSKMKTILRKFLFRKGMAESEVKVLVSKPDINKMITISIITKNRTYQTTIAERDKDQLTKKAIRQAVTNIVKFELGIKGKGVVAILQKNDLNHNCIITTTKPLKQNPVKGEAKQQYDHERYLQQKAKAIKVNA